MLMLGEGQAGVKESQLSHCAVDGVIGVRGWTKGFGHWRDMKWYEGGQGFNPWDSKYLNNVYLEV